jgi:selenocysteine lyase/cysteine desulfurase
MLTCQRHLFEIPDDVAYLNCAYMSPLMRPVVDAGVHGLHRKALAWEITPEHFFTGAEAFRATAARLLDCSADCVAITPSASYGIATAALNVPLRKGQSVLVLDEQFPSHYYSWQRLACERGASLEIVPWPEDGDWASAVLNRLHENVAIAALPNVQWTSGGRLDLIPIGERCRKIGAALVLDLTQSLGALPFSVREVQPDFAVAATYKWLLGPYSVGLMYVAPKWHDGRPLEENWIQRANAEDFTSLILYTGEYAEAARRFDMGERSNFALLPAATIAMEQILMWGVSGISAFSGALNRKIAGAASAVGFSVPPEQYRAPHYLCLRRQGGIPPELPAKLAREKVFVSVRGSSVRVTPHLYNSEADVDRLIRLFEGL